MVPKIFRKEDLINLNFAIHYTTDVNVKTRKMIVMMMKSNCVLLRF